MQTIVATRMMTAADIPAVLEIQHVCYTELTPESDASFHAKLSAAQSTCLIASIAGEIVGYLIALPWELTNPPALNVETCRLPPAPNCLYLHDLSVLPKARQSGTGRALVEAFLALLKQSKLERASLIAVQNSTRYWERYGFRISPLSELLKDKLATYGERVVYMVLDI